MCDNSVAIQFIKNRAENIRNRYIELKYMFIRDLYLEIVFDTTHVRSTDNMADFLTKSVHRFVFET